MSNRLAKGFIAGCIGAVILVVLMYIMKAMGMGTPPFVGMYRSAFGTNPPADEVIAVVLFIISGGIWGFIFGWMVKYPTVLKGMLFGILPTLWLWTVVPSALGKPLFNGFEVKGLIIPVIANMIIWGCFIGWYVQRNVRTVAL